MNIEEMSILCNPLSDKDKKDLLFILCGKLGFEVPSQKIKTEEPKTDTDKPKVLIWKQELSDVADNPDYIEMQISDINRTLREDRPDTRMIRDCASKIITWADEINLARGEGRYNRQCDRGDE